MNARERANMMAYQLVPVGPVVRTAVAIAIESLLLRIDELESQACLPNTRAAAQQDNTDALLKSGQETIGTCTTTGDGVSSP